MASASVTTRVTKAGERRFVVRYRLGGRAYPIEHGGSFRTMREARARRDLIGGELAVGRNPADLLRVLVEKPTTRTFAVWAEAYRTSRVDLAAETTKNLRSHLRAMEVFANIDPAAITTADVQEWVAALALKPSSARRYLATLRQVLDFADVIPNPAKDPRVRLPREEIPLVQPPSAREVDMIVENVPALRRLPLRVLEQTGLRIGELHRLAWGDVDASGSRFRVAHGKTRAARRWVTVPGWVMDAVLETCPPDDRTAERRVFPGFTPDVAKNIMARACRAAGIPHYHPHDLRHRYASVKIAEGVPVTDLAAQLGHSKKSLTLDVYSHVLLEDQTR